MFVDSLESYASQKDERYKVIKEIQTQLEAFQRRVASEQELEVKFEISKWKAPRVLSFSLKSKRLNESVDFDMLPAFNALGETPHTFTSGGWIWSDGGRWVAGKPGDLVMGPGSSAPSRWH